MANIIYIATSIDGYIARTDGSIEWLTEWPNPDKSDYGFFAFLDSIDGIIMGRNTFETVSAFDEWVYTKPVFVLSTTLTQLSGKWAAKGELIKGDLNEVLALLSNRGVNNIYVDGGKTIQSFLALDMIDQMIITTIPMLLGSGIPLFSDNAPELKFKHTATDIYNGGLVKISYSRDR
jgi:dihydrofolate reductase